MRSDEHFWSARRSAERQGEYSELAYIYKTMHGKATPGRDELYMRLIASMERKPNGYLWLHTGSNAIKKQSPP